MKGIAEATRIVLMDEEPGEPKRSARSSKSESRLRQPARIRRACGDAGGGLHLGTTSKWRVPYIARRRAGLAKRAENVARDRAHPRRQLGFTSGQGAAISSTWPFPT
jgi:hypothetical protein